MVWFRLSETADRPHPGDKEQWLQFDGKLVLCSQYLSLSPSITWCHRYILYYNASCVSIGYHPTSNSLLPLWSYCRTIQHMSIYFVLWPQTSIGIQDVSQASCTKQWQIEPMVFNYDHPVWHLRCCPNPFTKTDTLQDLTNSWLS